MRKRIIVSLFLLTAGLAQAAEDKAFAGDWRTGNGQVTIEQEGNQLVAHWARRVIDKNGQPRYRTFDSQGVMISPGAAKFRSNANKDWQARLVGPATMIVTSPNGNISETYSR